MLNKKTINTLKLFVLSVLLFLSCRDQKIVKEGFVPVEGGNIWYRIVGADKKTTPILMLHGGPGFPADYLAPLADLASDRPVIFYDQLGCGHSDRPNDSTLWQMERFARELKVLRTVLRLDRIHLFAHSAGTMLATEYLSTQPRGIETIIFASPVFSTPEHLTVVNGLKMKLPPQVRDSLLYNEQKGTIYSEGYQKAYDVFLKTYWCRKYPYPAEIQKSQKRMGDAVFKTMWGEYEFYCSGNLKHFDRSGELSRITVPTLFTCGRYDLCTPESTERYAKQVNNSEFKVFEQSAHMAMNEEPAAYVKTIREFLNKAESR